MAMPSAAQMGKKLTTEQLNEIVSSLTKAMSVLSELEPVHLTNKERIAAKRVSDKRFPYVQKTFTQLAIDFPELRPIYIDYPSALTNYEMMLELKPIIAQVAKLYDRFNDYFAASQDHAFRYMLHFYGTAKRYKQYKEVAEQFAPLFARQGPPNK